MFCMRHATELCGLYVSDLLFRNVLGSEVLLIVFPAGIRFLEANVELYTWLSAMVVESYGFRIYISSGMLVAAS